MPRREPTGGGHESQNLRRSKAMMPRWRQEERTSLNFLYHPPSPKTGPRIEGTSRERRHRPRAKTQAESEGTGRERRHKPRAKAQAEKRRHATSQETTTKARDDNKVREPRLESAGQDRRPRAKNEGRESKAKALSQKRRSQEQR
jgi:hypothetical protein